MSHWQKPPAEMSIHEFGSVEDKVLYLEKNLDILRAEVDMKMQIMEQILSTRNEQFVVQKKLIEKEHALYQSVINHWKNTADLAANGQSIRYSKNTQDFQVFEITTQAPVPPSTKRTSCSAFDSPLGMPRLRAKRLRTSGPGIEIQAKTEVEEDLSDSEEEVPEQGDGSSQYDPLDMVEMNAGVDSNSDGAEDDDGKEDVQSGMEMRVFINFYNENPSNPEEGSNDPIWLHFLREEGTGMSAVCKKCGELGYQHIYKFSTPSSMAVLRRHLRRKHKIVVEAASQIEATPPLKTDKPRKKQNGLRQFYYLRHNNQMYSRNCVRRGHEYWKCRDFRICSGKLVKRKDGTLHVTAEHTCLTSAADCDAAEFRERLREIAASRPLLRPTQVIALAKEGCTQEVLEIIPNDTALRQTISRIRISILESVAQEASDWT